MIKKVVIPACLVVILICASLVALHLGQKGHNRLDLDMDAEFPGAGSVVPGEIFATTMARIIEHELDGAFGWRPNDIVLWGPRIWADNNANRQLGIIQAIRETARSFKDELTKISSADYDPNLVQAETMFRNDASKFWFPSAENRFGDGANYLRTYVEGLRTPGGGSRPINKRNVEMIKLFRVWSVLLGDAHASLYRERSEDGRRLRCWKTDDAFYHSQGYTHAIYYMMLSLRREYSRELADREVLYTLFDEVLQALEQAAHLKPLIVLNGRPDCILANHRNNLDVFVSEAWSKMDSIMEELEK